MREVCVTDERMWLAEYLEHYRAHLLQPQVIERLIQLKELLQQTHADGKKSIVVGNGGSAAIASHVAVDLTKNAGIRCVNFNEADLITCLANDYGYERWVERALALYADPGDTVVLVSSSGKSANLVNAARFARTKKLAVVTLTGFAEDNPLKQVGDLNFWVNSRAYNVVEMTHHIWLLAVCDLIIGTADYPAVGPMPSGGTATR